MRVAVTGATGVLGRAAVPALVAEGHDVVALVGSPERSIQAERLGATVRVGDVLDGHELVAMFEGCDAVCNLGTHLPIGYAGPLPRTWRLHDRLRTVGVQRVVTAARRAGVRRVVQESVSFVYADAGDDWIDERSSLDINRATEPACVGESLVQDYTCDSRTGVVLRFGAVVGDDDLTRRQLRGVRHGLPIGLGSPQSWVHLVHAEDVGPAVVAALTAPSGVYNVGADPVRRADLVHGYTRALGRARGDLLRPLMVRLAGPRAEPLTRSLRVSSSAFSGSTGWTPRRSTFDPSWLEAGAPTRAAR